MDVSARIDAHLPQLTPAERKVAAVVMDDPESVAFGTVADIARRSGASGATVVRLAAKLGYDGFVDLQAAVRSELARRLRPASQRMRRIPAAGPDADVVARTLACELANVAGTLEAVRADGFLAAVAMMAGPVGTTEGRRGGRRGVPGAPGRVFVLSGDSSAGIATLLAGELGLLRAGVECVNGSAVRVEGALAGAGAGDTLVVIDLSRYDRETVDASIRAAARGVRIVALTDSALSPLADVAEVAFSVSDTGAGPFDSHVGILALANALIAGVAAQLRRHATTRLDRVEAAWRTAGALLEP